MHKDIKDNKDNIYNDDNYHSLSNDNGLTEFFNIFFKKTKNIRDQLPLSWIENMAALYSNQGLYLDKQVLDELKRIIGEKFKKEKYNTTEIKDSFQYLSRIYSKKISSFSFSHFIMDLYFKECLRLEDNQPVLDALSSDNSDKVFYAFKNYFNKDAAKSLPKETINKMMKSNSFRHLTLDNIIKINKINPESPSNLKNLTSSDINLVRSTIDYFRNNWRKYYPTPINEHNSLTGRPHLEGYKDKISPDLFKDIKHYDVLSHEECHVINFICHISINTCSNPEKKKELKEWSEHQGNEKQGLLASMGRYFAKENKTESHQAMDSILKVKDITKIGVKYRKYRYSSNVLKFFSNPRKERQEQIKKLDNSIKLLSNFRNLCEKGIKNNVFFVREKDIKKELNNFISQVFDIMIEVIHNDIDKPYKLGSSALLEICKEMIGSIKQKDVINPKLFEQRKEKFLATKFPKNKETEKKENFNQKIDTLIKDLRTDESRISTSFGQSS